jgi:hypothetical protein
MLKSSILSLLPFVIFADLPVGYNQPAAVQIDRGWDIHSNVSYLYWFMSQDGMDLGYITPSASIPIHPIAYQSFGYHSGFKVGLGANTSSDGWAVDAEYTWYHNHTNRLIISDTGGYTPNWFSTLTGSTSFPHLDSTWKLRLDILDLVGSRPFYQGKTLTISPSAGLRGLLLRQHVQTAWTGLNTSPLSIVSAIGNYNSKCWALGIVAHADHCFLLGKGFRIDGLIGGSLLYTHYDAISIRWQSTQIYLQESVVKNIPALRPTFDAGLGIGYARYGWNHKLHFDISARYDFNLFWSQNMMRAISSQFSGTDGAIGDLFLHGLTADFRINF